MSGLARNSLFLTYILIKKHFIFQNFYCCINLARDERFPAMPTTKLGFELHIFEIDRESKTIRSGKEFDISNAKNRSALLCMSRFTQRARESIALSEYLQYLHIM